jgi:hypothetical protein
VQVRKLSLLLFALFGVAYALFTQDIVSHNTLCRAAMTANLVQNGRVGINGYEKLTDDIARREGTYYCDKAPGMSFLAVPAAAAFTRLAAITHETPYNRTWLVFLYLCALTTSGLLSALAAVAIFNYVLGRTQELNAALVASVAFGLGTPVWGWATSFFSHSAAAALLVLGFIAFDAANRQLSSGGHAMGAALLGGLLLGGAVAVEYTAFVPTVIIGAAAALASAWSRPAAVIRMFAVSAVGALIALAPVLMFHNAAFGSPLTTGYAFTVVFDAHRSGIFGINLPRLDVLGKLLVSAERGVIWYAPVVIAVAVAVVTMMRDPKLRATAIVVVLVAAYYLVMNAGFEYWHGGASTGPRYLTPAIGLSMLALGLAWPQFGSWQRRGTVALLGLSIFINFAATAVDMTAGALTEHIFPSFFAGDLRYTLTYRLYKQPSLLHFVAPVLLGTVLGWLTLRQARRAQDEIAGTLAVERSNRAGPELRSSPRGSL